MFRKALILALLFCSTALAQRASELRPKILNGVRYANQYATGGAGTTGDPWVGWETAFNTSGHVHFPAGFYDTNNNILIDQADTMITGDGIDVTTVRSGSGWVNTQDDADGGYNNDTWATDVFLVQVSNVSISDLSIVGPNEANTSYSNECIEFDARNGSISGFRVERVETSNCRHGIALNSDHAATNTSSNGLVVGCQVHDNKSFGIQGKFGPTTNWVIRDNLVSSNPVGIGLSRNCDRNVITGNVVTGSTTVSIGITTGSDGNTVSNNQVVGGTTGISVNGSDGTNHIQSNRNVVDGNVVSGVVGNGITADQCSDNVISNNTVSTSTNNGIVISGTANNNADRNLVTGNVVTSSTDHGIRITATTASQTTRNSVTGNTVTGSGLSGINVDSGQDNLVSGNVSSENTNYGVLVAAAGARSTISGNELAGNTSGAISDASATTRAFGNVVSTIVGGMSLGSGLDSDIPLTFDQGTGTDPRIYWDDSADLYEFDFDATVADDGNDPFVNTTSVGVPLSVVFEGATANASETTLTVTDPTADRTVTLPNASGTPALALAGSTTEGAAIWHSGTTACTTICTNVGLTCRDAFQLETPINTAATAVSTCADTTSAVRICYCST